MYAFIYLSTCSFILPMPTPPTHTHPLATISLASISMGVVCFVKINIL